MSGRESEKASLSVSEEVSMSVSEREKESVPVSMRNRTEVNQILMTLNVVKSGCLTLTPSLLALMSALPGADCGRGICRYRLGKQTSDPRIVWASIRGALNAKKGKVTTWKHDRHQPRTGHGRPPATLKEEDLSLALPL